MWFSIRIYITFNALQYILPEAYHRFLGDMLLILHVNYSLFV